MEAVPEQVRESYERLRTCHTYGVLWYDAFTVAADLSFLVLEQALRTRFVEFYGGAIPLVNAQGEASTLQVGDFEEVFDAFKGRSGQYARGGWKLQLRAPGGPLSVPRSIEPLMVWAHREGLLHGQRNKRMVPLRSKMRHNFAHGGGFRIGTPNESSQNIRDLAEIINRLWGASTPGGRLYPAPLEREVVVVGWTGQAVGVNFVRIRPEQILWHEERDPGPWRYVVLLAVPTDERLWEFDARYELTTYPAELLWGSGSSEELLGWWKSAAVETDRVEYLDRLFAVRVDGGKTYPAQRPDVFLGLPPDRRGGIWHLVRADFPLDAFNHVRHFLVGDCRSTADPGQGCPVEDVAKGGWEAVRDSLLGETRGAVVPSPFQEVCVPRRFPLPEDVGCD